ncbi:MAG: signal recognition particle subunit SRP19/SEC65 family protein [Methanomassiliicoccales archaeon]|jgi:signal recognition particle subunit SRP19|nr:signal recognition particle subunit SRP19/SEC65 family protein [Methanomassiliicoccales archaeon]
MVFDEDTAWVLWPEYFDIKRKRSQGRKVRRSLAINDPTVELLAKAVEKLGLEYRIEKDKAYPSNWWDHKGRILVEKSMPKSKLIALVAAELSKIQRS